MTVVSLLSLGTCPECNGRKSQHAKVSHISLTHTYTLTSYEKLQFNGFQEETLAVLLI